MLTADTIISTEVEYRNVPRVWQLGHRGQGQVVPIVDTGVNPQGLPAGALQGQVDLTVDRDNIDHIGHGTLMAKFILGIAPEAKVFSVKALSNSGPTTREDLIKALDCCAALQPPPRFINFSVAVRRGILWARVCTPKKLCALCTRVDELWHQGIATVAAAGNFSSRPGSITCPAASRWSIKTRALEHRGEAPHGELELVGTSQAAAFMTGDLTLLASAFPKKPAANVYAVLHQLGVRLESRGKAATADVFQVGVGEHSIPNVYRAYVFLRQATTTPKTMNHDESMALVGRAAGKLRSVFEPDEIMDLTNRALNLDESNYLAYFCLAIALDSMGFKDKAAEMLQRCNELLPPAEALSNLRVYGGRPK